MLMGLLLGLSCHFLSESDRFTRGLVWASGPCLRFGVALLGLRLSVGDVATLGWNAILVVCAAVVMTLIFGVMWARLLGCDRHLGLLTGGAVGICGASAAMAITMGTSIATRTSFTKVAKSPVSGDTLYPAPTT